ncbi:MAG: polysulfide reductase NrfD [Gammaproteobacteria bacterium]|nr:polysulfide reductase NrfD [Gammaproteobacteria bacterium]
MSNETALKVGVTRSKTGYVIVLLVLGLLALAGFFTYFYVLNKDPGPEAWGLFTVNFVFLLGVSQFGVVFSAIMRVCKARWPKPFYRLAETATVAFFPFAIVAFLFIYFYGRHDLLYWLSYTSDDHHNAWLNADWLLYRNLFAQLFFYAIAFIYFFMALAPDIDDDMVQSGPGWRRALYRMLLFFKSDEDREVTDGKLYNMSVVVMIAFVLPNTFIAWDFGMMLFPHYHSTVYPMYFIMGNLFAGSAALVLLHVLLSRYTEEGVHFGVRQIQNMGVLLTGFALLWLYFHWAQFFVTWFGNLPHEYGPLWKQMYGHYAPFFWIMLICVVGIPIAFLIFQKIKRTLWTMQLVTIIMVVGIWINRYLAIMPALVDDHVVFNSFLEAVITFGWFASYFFVLLLLFSVFPMISRWEMVSSSGDRPTEYVTYTFK